MLGKAKVLGEKLKGRFEAWQSWQRRYVIIGEIRGLGAMLGLARVTGAGREPAAEEAKNLATVCLERGLIILVCGTYSNVVRVLVPFVITDEQLGKGLGIIEDGIAHSSN